MTQLSLWSLLHEQAKATPTETVIEEEILSTFTRKHRAYLFGPVIQFRSGGWPFPGTLLTLVRPARYVSILDGEDDLATELEALGYISTASLEAPLSRVGRDHVLAVRPGPAPLESPSGAAVGLGDAGLRAAARTRTIRPIGITAASALAAKDHREACGQVSLNSCLPRRKSSRAALYDQRLCSLMLRLITTQWRKSSCNPICFSATNPR